MEDNLIAIASVDIEAGRDEVWRALVTPEAIQEYMFGSRVETTWRVGTPITWSGEWQGKSYTDTGKILRFEPLELLQYSHFSPLAGLPDEPNNYHTVTVTLSPAGTHTRVSLSQDHCANEEERAHSEQNWGIMLESLKKVVERK